MSAVPWKDLAYQFFPRQNAPVVVEFQDAKGVVTLDKDARNRVFDVERARLLFARTRFGGERRVEVSCTSPDACQIRDWLRPYFKNVGLEINGTSSLREAAQGTLRVSNGVIFNTGANGTTHAPATTLALANNGTFANVRLGQNPGIGDCHNHEAPDWVPTSLATLAGGQLAPVTPPNDGFFEVTTFIGAFSPDPEQNWAAGWTSFPQR